MKSSFNHIQIHVSNTEVSFLFYKKLLTFLDYKIVHEDETHLGMRNEPTDIWLKKVNEKHKSNKYHRKNIGLNHVCFKVSSKEEVDKFAKEFLQKNKIPTLYNTPKLFPEYTKDYYAVFFEDPDRIKIEVVYL